MSELVWTCTECAQPIADRDGHLLVDISEVQKHEREWAAFWAAKDADSPKGATLAELFELPGRVAWRAVHVNCYPEGNTYDIAVADIRTESGLLDQTAHMLEKTWLQATNWDTVLRTRVRNP